MRKRKHKPNKKITVDQIIFLCIITTIIVAFLTLSKYQSTSAGSANTKVAVPIMELSSENTLQVSVSPIGEEKTYIFQVANNTKEQTSQVSMEYNLQVKSLNNLPLEFELYTYENNEKGEKDLLSGNGNITENMVMKVNEATIHQYILVIKWNPSSTSYQYSEVADYVQIVLHSDQID